jgi:chaperonin GroES
MRGSADGRSDDCNGGRGGCRPRGATVVSEPPGGVRQKDNGVDSTSSSKQLEVVEPIGKRVLVRKDEDKKTTKGGIQLPGNIEIPTITGRVVAVSAQIERDEDYPIRQYDKVLFNPKNAIPVDFEGDNRLFVVPVEDIVALFRRPKE